MKPIAAAILLLFGMTASAQTASMTGAWKLHMDWPEGASEGTCTFQQDGEKLSGTCGDKDRFPVSGYVNGTHVSWAFGIEVSAWSSKANSIRRSEW